MTSDVIFSVVKFNLGENNGKNNKLHNKKQDYSCFFCVADTNKLISILSILRFFLDKNLSFVKEEVYISSFNLRSNSKRIKSK